ncbi:MAG: phenylalanine--tRNA ligase subunit beta, partial [Clostridia bacterium]|nr:phenylalanine--tRNA ligase subunit beta [Clostridia bacterium]
QQDAIERALTLVYESGSGDIVGGKIDVKAPYQTAREVEFTIKDIEQILGCEVPKRKLISILEKLGIEVVNHGDKLLPTVGEDREDIVGVNDIAEEFIRVYGYKHIKPTLFKFATLMTSSVPDKIKVVDMIKSTLCSCGLHESVTYSFTSPDFADKLGLAKDDSARKYVRLLNPIGEALSVMRTTLTHSMIEALTYNLTHFNKDASLFEVARVYLPKSLPLEELPTEEERLCIGMYGDGCDFFTVKAAVEEVLSALKLKAEYVRSSRPYLHTGRSAEVMIGGKSVGFIGEVHPSTMRGYGVDNTRFYIAELSIDDMFSNKNLEKPKFAAFSKFPTIERDLAVVVKDEVLVGDILKAIEGAKIKYLTDTQVFDTYKSEQIGVGKKSVGVSFSFSSLERTLTDDEIAEQMARILSVLKRKVGAKIR